MLKHVKAIGWFVKEYGIAQVSMNLTNMKERRCTRRSMLLRNSEQTRPPCHRL